MSVEHLDDGVNDYRLLGQVVLDDDLYYAEVVHWQDIGHTFHRFEGAKGWATRKAAVRDLTRRGEKQV